MASRGPLFVIVLCLWVLVLSTSSPGLVRAQAGTIALNQKRVEISALVKKVGEATERSILFDESVRGSVSIIAKRSVDLDEAWTILESSLAILGFSLLPSTEGHWRIAKIADAVGSSPFVRSVGSVGDSFVTTLIPLRVAAPDAVIQVLSPLAGSNVTLVPLQKSNSLIASGPERRIARLTTIADALDRVDEFEVRSRVLRYRAVGDITGYLKPSFDSGFLSARKIEVWSDERTNSLIYRGQESEVARLLDLVSRFDRPVEGEGLLRVLRVLNRDPADVAELIEGLRAGGGARSGRSTRPGSRLPSSSSLVDKDYSIGVDAASRSLVVRADSQTHKAIREVLEIVDQPPQLIAVDLKVTEVRTPSRFSLGLDFSIPLSAGDDGGEVIARLVSTPTGSGLAATPSADTTLFSRVDQDLNLPLFTDPTTGIAIPITNTGVIQAGDISARAEVLMEPSLVLTSGDSHELFVGTNVPVPVSGNEAAIAANPTSGGQNVLSRTTTFERRDIGIKILLEASASKVGPIALDLDVEISALAPSVAGSIELVGPTFIDENIVANARLNDGEVAVFAMNVNKTTTRIRSGTPFLSAIPFIGFLFSRMVDREEDVRLVFAAQVRRVGSPAELAADSIRRRLAFERRNARRGTLPSVAPDEPAYAVLVTTRTRQDDAEAIRESLALRGFETEIHSWDLADQVYFDVYVRALESMAEAADVAYLLNKEGWQADLTLLPTRS